MTREAIEAYILQVLSSVSESAPGAQYGVTFHVGNAIVLLQRGGEHYRVVVERIELVPVS